MTYCKEKYTGHGTVWHNARWNTLVVVPHNTMPGEIHGLWYRITHCQVKYTGRGTVWHITRWNTLVVVLYNTLPGEIHWSFRMITISVDVYDLPLNKITSHILIPVVWSEKLITCDQRHLTLISWKVRCRQIDKTNTLLKSHLSYHKTIIYIHI